MAVRNVIRVADIESWERSCPYCCAVTQRRSIDGGMTSQYHGECGHSWDVTPFGKMIHATLTAAIIHLKTDAKQQSCTHCPAALAGQKDEQPWTDDPTFYSASPAACDRSV